MAANSISERITEAVKVKMETISSIAKVTRKLPMDLKELGQVADTEIPLIAVSSKLPKSNPHKNPRSSSQSIDTYQSILEVSVTCFYQYDGRELDVVKKDLADDVFKALNSDQTFGLGRVITNFEILENVAEIFMDPYGAFQYILRLKYSHGIGGI